MRLRTLTLHNFKGLTNFQVCADGSDLSIFGDNAVGKSTIADAFYWLLFNKDSLNRGTFEIKTIDKATGEVKHNLVHSVEGVIELEGGKTIVLRKEYKEDWVQKRGPANPASLEGHKTDYFINGVPVLKKDYDAKVNDFCPVDRFRDLTDPTHFNVHRNWEMRRRILFDLLGDLTDQEVIDSNPALKSLPELMGDHSLDDFRGMVDSVRKKINNRIKEIPTRIDEASRQIEMISDTPIDTKEVEGEIEALQTQLAGLTSGGAVAEQQTRIAEIDAAMLTIKNRLASSGTDDHAVAMQAVRECAQNLSVAEQRLDSLERTQKSNQFNKAEAEQLEAGALTEYREQKSKQFEWSDSGICSACGQALPTEQIEEKRSAQQESFNLLKAETLERIKARGATAAAKVAELAKALENDEAWITETSGHIESLKAELAKLKADAESKVATPADPMTDPEYFALAQEKLGVQSKIEELSKSVETARADLGQKILVKKNVLADHIKTNAAIEGSKQIKARIEELEAKEKDLIAEHEELSRSFELTEEFIRTKVRLLTDRINSRFSIARFKLFHEQVNGGLAECCETEVDGVPYGSLNSGMRTNVGLDIINTFADHFGFAPPVFVDNAESVTELLPTVGQQIRLVVSAPDKTLRVEESRPTETQKELAI